MTKKEMQKIENEMVEKAWEKAQKVWVKGCKKVDRLNYCKAWVYQTSGYCFFS